MIGRNLTEQGSVAVLQSKVSLSILKSCRESLHRPLLSVSIEQHDISKSVQMPGVVAFVSAADVPGENLVGLGGMDAEIFASKKAEYLFQPLGLIVAETPKLAEQAAKLVQVAYSHPKVPQAFVRSLY